MLSLWGGWLFVPTILLSICATAGPYYVLETVKDKDLSVTVMISKDAWINEVQILCGDTLVENGKSLRDHNVDVSNS